MKQLLRILALLIFAASPALAQGVHYNDVARTADNRPLSNGAVAVCVANPTSPGNVGEPCAPLAAIYADPALSAPAANPILADTNGNFSFWAAPGTYFIEFYSPGKAIVPFTETITLGCVPNSSAAGCGSGITRDVRAYGALCNDTNDDTAAIQAAVNSLPTSGAAIGGIVSFPGVCMTTSAINVTTPNVTFEGIGHFQFITQNAPPSYIDFQGATPQNALNISAQGFAMSNMGVKYPTTIGGPLAAPLAPALTTVSGSGCPAEAYYVEATYVSAQGQTNVSPEATITTASGQCFKVTAPASETGATGWNVFVSSNPNNETLQVSSPLAIGTSWTFAGTLANLGFRPAVNTTAYAAIYDPNGAQLDGVKIFTNDAATAGTASTANGYTSFGCCGKLENVYIAGFGIGVFGSGSNNDFSIKDSYIQSDYVGALIVNGADINIEDDDFEGNVVGNLKMLYGSPYQITGNYFEQQGSNPPSYNVQLGDNSIPPQGFTPTPGAINLSNNFMQCNLTAYPPSPIVVDTSQVLDIERNSFSQCGHENIVDDLSTGASAHINMLGNISDAQPLAWLTHTTGLIESDVESIGTAENPGTPYFYGLGIDSQSGASQLNFNEAGAPAWQANATTSAFSLANNGASAFVAAPFGAGTHPDMLSTYAASAAEVIVTQSGNSATFDASLGNTFELIMNANVTSVTLENMQPGQWLDFIICQGGGGPWTFAWPSNVFGGGAVGTTSGDCSTQTFYVSGTSSSNANAWAAGPMLANLTSGSSGPSLLGVSGTVPYFTGSWTNGNCLAAGGSPGLITVTSSACGSGSGGGGSPGGGSSAVQFNNGGAFGGDATNFFYTTSTHALTLTGPLTASSLTLTSQNSLTLGSGSQTNPSYVFVQSGSGGSNTNPGYFEAAGSPANAFNSFLYPCQQAGNWCASSTTPSADSNRTLAAHGAVNAQAGTSYTIQTTDEDGLTTFNNSSAVAVSLPCPNGASFANGWREMLKMTGAGTPTITTSGCNINGATTFAIPTAGVWLVSDGANYWTVQ
ncbi:MAG TPA: hypothetical protein VGR81_00350 [Candidatus Acidoferrales bacterium]|nr:hypothetical protein [Candidatus Acidoferrales bacterium]